MPRRKHAPGPHAQQPGLMTITAWREKYFSPGSAPTRATVVRQLEHHQLPGLQVGGTWYIHEPSWLAELSQVAQPPQARCSSTASTSQESHRLVSQVLAGMGANQ